MAVLTTLILVGIGSFWEAGETARELPNGQQSPGLDSASATAEPVEAVAIPAETLDSELDEIWRATDGVGQRMPQGGSDAASLLRQVVWELGEELRSLEQELDSPLTTPPPVENRPEPSPHEFSNFPFNKGDSHEDRP
jgi:hypothetical protein